MNMNQIAKLVGVSVATVSRAFTTPEKVRPEVRARIMSIAAENNYVYNASAADLKRRVSKSIGILFPQRMGAVFTQTFIAAQEQFQEHGMSLIIGHTKYDIDIETAMVRQFLERQVAGIIFTGFTSGNEAMIKSLPDYGVSTVIIWELLKGSGFNYIGFDNYKAAYRATDYLIQMGHERIALLAGPHTKIGRIRKRLEGYQDALAKNNLEINPDLVVSTELGFIEGREAMQRILMGKVRPTAVFAASDYLAVGALKAIKEAGLKVPEDISLVGLDDAEFSAFCDPPLTTVRVPSWDIGRLAAKVLLEIKPDSTHLPVQYCLDADLIIRDSCASPK